MRDTLIHRKTESDASLAEQLAWAGCRPRRWTSHKTRLKFGPGYGYRADPDRHAADNKSF